MIRVVFHFYSVLAQLIGDRQINKEIPQGVDILGAIQILALEYPNAFRDMLSPDGTPGNYLKVFVNESMINREELHNPLKEGDDIKLFPVIAGG